MGFQKQTPTQPDGSAGAFVQCQSRQLELTAEVADDRQRRVCVAFEQFLSGQVKSRPAEKPGLGSSPSSFYLWQLPRLLLLEFCVGIAEYDIAPHEVEQVLEDVAVVEVDAHSIAFDDVVTFTLHVR
jgi:hypothetical protein